METNENPTTEATKPHQRLYLSIDEIISRMKLTFGNATLPEIFEPMKSVGYTIDRINGLNTKVSELEVLQQLQKKEYSEQYEASKTFDNARFEIDALYTKHRSLAKILFKSDVQTSAVLQLTKTKPLAFGNWLQHLTNFYAQLITSPELQTKAATVGITAESVTAQKQSLINLEKIKENQRKETSEAQSATDARDRAFDELYPQYSEYIQYAKVIFVNNQALEAIGVKVKLM